MHHEAIFRPGGQIGVRRSAKVLGAGVARTLEDDLGGGRRGP